MESIHEAGTASRFAGIAAAAGRDDDWRAVVRQKDQLVASLGQAKYVDLLPSYNTVAYLEGQARLMDGGVAVDGSVIQAGNIIIATGAAPELPPISGIATVPYLTSTTALELELLAKSLLIIGGGYIGCELGQMFARAGVKVTIAFRNRLLPEAEPEIGEALTRYFRDEGVVVCGGLSYRDIRQGPEGVALSVLADGAAQIITTSRLSSPRDASLTWRAWVSWRLASNSC
jgi:mercuric reductase